MSHFLARTVVESSAITHCVAGRFSDAQASEVLIVRGSILELLTESSPGTLTITARQPLSEQVLGLDSLSGHGSQAGASERVSA
jgi:hypothetical protein